MSRTAAENYRVTFDRIGHHANVEPITVTAKDDQAVADAVTDMIRRDRLIRSNLDVQVAASVKDRSGHITVDGRPAGTFRLTKTQQDATEPAAAQS